MVVPRWFAPYCFDQVTMKCDAGHKRLSVVTVGSRQRALVLAPIRRVAEAKEAHDHHGPCGGLGDGGRGGQGEG